MCQKYIKHMCLSMFNKKNMNFVGSECRSPNPERRSPNPEVWASTYYRRCADEKDQFRLRS